MIVLPTARPLGGGFNPSKLSGLALWLDAADASTITLDGSNNVEQWNDKSGNGRNATQTTVLNRPGYFTNQLNGLPAIRGNSTTAHMTLSGPNMSSGYTFVWVFNTATTTSSGIYGQYPSSGTGNGIAIWSGLFRSGRTGTSITAPTGQGALGAGAPTTGMIANDCVNPTANTAFRGAWNASERTSTTTQNASTPAAGTATIFAVSPSGPDSPSSENIYEIVIYTRVLTTDEKTLLRSYITGKWGLTWL